MECFNSTKSDASMMGYLELTRKYQEKKGNDQCNKRAAEMYKQKQAKNKRYLICVSVYIILNHEGRKPDSKYYFMPSHYLPIYAVYSSRKGFEVRASFSQASSKSLTLPKHPIRLG